MTIHSKFWKERRASVAQCSIRWTKRDSNRKRCYKWEWANLRPVQSKFETRDAAKGFARLCMKIAVKHLVSKYGAEHEDTLRASFKAAFTKERLAHCDGASGGVYFAEWGWTDVVIAHEVAHWADQWEHKLRGHEGRMNYEPHGPRWRGWFIHILSHAGMRKVGNRQDVAALMLNSLEANSLKWHFP